MIMPVKPIHRLPDPTIPVPPDVENPVKYRFSGIIMNKIIDDYGNIVVVYAPKNQPLEYSRRCIRYATINAR